MLEQLGDIRIPPSKAFNEIVAYEMLWAERKMTQSKVTKLFAGVVIIEAESSSGSVIQAKEALKQ